MNKPKVRFKGYTGEWEVVSIGDIFTVNPNTPIPDRFNYINLESVQNAILKSYINTNKNEAPSRAKRVLEIGDYLFQNVRPYQKNNIIFNESGTYVASTGYTVFRSIEKNTNFLKTNLLKDDIQNQIKLRCTGTSYPAITANELKNIKIKVPSIEEQQKIGNLFKSLDQEIELLEENIELKKLNKKGLMQKIFNQEIRFSGYTDEWVEQKLEEFVLCLDIKRKPLNSNQRNNIKGNIPYYGANGIQGYINDYIFDERLVLLAEDGGNFDDYDTKGNCQLIEGKAWVNNHAHVIKSDDVYFLYYSLNNKDLRIHINGTSRSKLNKSEMLKISIKLPNLEEQQKIGILFKSLDEEIELLDEQLRLKKLNKKYYMQTMFC